MDIEPVQGQPGLFRLNGRCGPAPPMLFIGTPENDAAWDRYRRCIAAGGFSALVEENPSTMWRLGVLAFLAGTAALLWRAQTR